MLEIYIDGASKGNPGPSGIGFIIIQNKQIIEGQNYVGERSNHETEFLALLFVLDYCQEHFPDQILSVRSDSKLVVDLVNRGHYKKEPFDTLVDQALTRINSFPYCFLKWIPEQQNKSADRLAKQAIQLKRELIKKFPSA